MLHDITAMEWRNGSEKCYSTRNCRTNLRKKKQQIVESYYALPKKKKIVKKQKQRENSAEIDYHSKRNIVKF